MASDPWTTRYPIRVISGDDSAVRIEATAFAATDPPNFDNSTNIEFAQLDPSRMRSPFTFAPLPHEFFPYLGQIALLWGQYEKSLNDMIVALCSYNKSDLPPNWQHRLSYEQRAKRFDDEAKIIFGVCPFIYLYLKNIIADAFKIKTKRDVLLHGTIELDVHIHNNKNTTPLVKEVELIAMGRQKKQPIEIRFKFEDIQDLFYEMGHLAGRMNTFNVSQSGYVPLLPFASWQDIYLVQDVLRKHHPAHTKHPKPQSPP